MAPPINIELVNGIAGDPAVVVSFQNIGESVLFDAGSLDKLSNKELLKIRTVCISHAHVDHFIGFDRLIRVNIPHFRIIDVIGPQGIASQVRSKILGYTWNLLEPNQINYRIHEVSVDGKVSSFHLSNSNQFALIAHSETAPLVENCTAKVPLANGNYELSAVILDHGTPVCGFSLKLPDTLHVSTEGLEGLGLSPGPWIGELQKRAASGLDFGEVKLSNGVVADGQKLADKLFTSRRGQQITYITDIIFSKSNLDLMKSAFSGSDILICETNYRHEHRDRAYQKKHLTTKQAALLAAMLKCPKLTVFHVSNIYGQETAQSEVEAAEFLSHFSNLGADDLAAEIDLESLTRP